MEAASRGARAAGGTVLGLLPGDRHEAANAYCTVVVPTGLGEARNALVVRAADAIIAVGGEFGTLSEIALGLKLSKPVVGIDTWQLRRHGALPEPNILNALSPREAVEIALEQARARIGDGGD
jgi:hypothetical protein